MMVLAARASPTASSMRYCRTCGQALSSGARCHRCGSRGEAPVLSSMSALANRKTDPWLSRYASSIDADLQQNITSECEIDGEDERTREALVESKEEKRLRTFPTSGSSNAYPSGIGMPSSISRDLRLASQIRSCDSASFRCGTTLSRQEHLNPSDNESVEADDSIGSLPALKERLSHLPHSVSQPLLQHSSGGILSKVCGSVIEPADSRNKWACSDCSLVFARDSTVYVPPASAVHQGIPNKNFYCMVCYTKRYALGICARSACQKPVLGSTKETGAFVKAGEGRVYHGTCFRCHSCDAGGGKPPLGDGTDVMLDMEGRPSCEDCFGSAPRRREVAGVSGTSTSFFSTALSPSLASTLEYEGKGSLFPPKHGRRDPSPAKKAGNPNMSAALAELSQKFETSNGRNRQLATQSPSMANSKSISRDPNCTLPGKSPSGDSAGSFARDAVDLSALPTTLPSAATKMRTHTKGGFPLPRNRADVGTQAEASHLLEPTRAANSSSLCQAPALKDEKVEVSPTHLSRPPLSTEDVICAACGKGPFDGPTLQGDFQQLQEAKMITLPSVSSSNNCSAGSSFPARVSARLTLSLHAACFQCDVCKFIIDGDRAFVRLDADRTEQSNSALLPLFSHPSCAPPARIKREDYFAVAAAVPALSAAGRDPTSDLRQQQERFSSQHPTIRSVPRPSATEPERKHVAIHSFLRRAESYKVERQRQELQKVEGLDSQVRVSQHQQLTSGDSPRNPTLPSTRTSTSTSDPRPKHQCFAATPSYFTTSGTTQRFKATSGAAPPTRSSLIPKTGFVGPNCNPAAGMFTTVDPSRRSKSPERSSFPVPIRSQRPLRRGMDGMSLREEDEAQDLDRNGSSRSSIPPHPLSQDLSLSSPPAHVIDAATRSNPSPTVTHARYGGMLNCAGCAGRLTTLESIPGPAGSHWHRKCLVCRAGAGSNITTTTSAVGRGQADRSATGCGKQLDSFAKVRREDGAVRCAECFRAGR